MLAHWKYRKQADEFLAQKENFKNQKVEYEKLLDKYEIEIENLNNKQGRTEKENAYLRELLLREGVLRRLVG